MINVFDYINKSASQYEIVNALFKLFCEDSGNFGAFAKVIVQEEEGGMGMVRLGGNFLN